MPSLLPLIIGMASLVIIAGIAGAFLFTRHKREEEAARLPKKPPHAIAYEALEELNKRD